MRLWLALAVMGASGIFAQAAADVPPWLILIGGVLGTGFGGRIIIARLERKWDAQLQDATAAAQKAAAKTSQVEARELEERLQTSLLARAEADYGRMVARLSEAESRAAASEVASASKDAEIERLKNKVQLLSQHVERLQDQIAALSRGRAPERRTDDA